MAMERKKIAIDIGNVIFTGPYFDLVPNALESIRILSEIHDLYILSSCHLKTEDKCREKLVEFGIDKIIDSSKWMFVRSPEDKIKKMKLHEIDYLIDDKVSTIKKCKKELGKKSGVLFTNWNNIV